MMTTRQNPILKTALSALVALLLGVGFAYKALQNYRHQDYLNSNFFSFWLSGHMVWTGENPYDSSQWLGNFDAFGATYQPSRILQYPLPLMYLMAPLGLFPLGQAYFAWQMVTQIAMAATIYALLNHWPDRSERLLFLPLVVFASFFGPVYLTLQVGALGAIALLAILMTILLLEKERPLPAGMMLSLTMLKPPQGLALLALAGIWFIAKRNWKSIAGIVLGGLTLLTIWILRDPLWLTKFGGSSEHLLDLTLGAQSNVFSFAFLVCGQNMICTWTLGTAGTLLALGLGAYYLWRNRARLTAWEAFNVIIPLGFVSTIYLWSYDQLPYIIPITWIAGTLVERTKSYLRSFVFLIVLDALAFIALTVQAYTHKDLLSIVTTLLTLGMCLWLMRKPSSETAKSTGTPLVVK